MNCVGVIIGITGGQSVRFYCIDEPEVIHYKICADVFHKALIRQVNFEEYLPILCKTAAYERGGMFNDIIPIITDGQSAADSVGGHLLNVDLKGVIIRFGPAVCTFTIA